jgi:hypothetical protein
VFFLLELGTVCLFFLELCTMCFLGGAYIAAVLGFENAPQEIQAQFRQILEVRTLFLGIDWWWCLDQAICVL